MKQIKDNDLIAEAYKSVFTSEQYSEENSISDRAYEAAEMLETIVLNSETLTDSDEKAIIKVIEHINQRRFESEYKGIEKIRSRRNPQR